MAKYFPSKSVLIALILLCSFHLFSNLVWIFLSTAPIPWDQAGHTRLAIQFADFFKSFGFLRIIDYFSISTYYPPFIYSLISVPIIIFGNPIQVSEVAITLFFLLSIVLVYIYSYELFKNSKAAIFASFFYSFFPIIYEHSRWMILEIPLLCLILLTLIFLKKSESFTNRKNTLIFFTILSFAFLTKWLTLIYVLIPISFEIISWVKLPDESKKGTLDHILKGIGLLIVFVAPWYIINFSSLFPDAKTYITPEASDPHNLFSLNTWTFYSYIFINFQITLYSAIIAIISFIYFFVSKYKYKIFFASYILSIYLIFTLIPNKDWRYTMPILPLTAIIMGLFIDKLRSRFSVAGWTMIIIVFSIIITYYTSLSFRFPITNEIQRAIKIPIIGWIDYININDNLAHKYNQEDWKQKDILSAVSKDQRVWILNLVDLERFNAGNLLLQRDILNLRNVEVDSPPPSVFNSDYEIISYMAKYKYVLIAKQEVGNPATRNISVFNQIKNVIENGTVKYSIIQTYILPNGDDLMLYERTQQ